MPCEWTTGQCLALAPQGEVPVCCPPFSVEYGFEPTDTNGRHPGCWIGIVSEGQSEDGEIREGRWCGWGCAGSAGDDANCDDTLLTHMGNSLDGRRWLAPVEDSLVSSGRDARGIYHDLRSNEYRAMPPAATHWYRGTCWYNDGRECFGPDVCACWAKGDRVVPPGEAHCQPDEIPIGQPLHCILPDSVYRSGYSWPPSAYVPGGSNSLLMGSYYCRRFTDSRAGDDHRSRVTLGTSYVGDTRGVIEGILPPIGANMTQCHPNILIYCAANCEHPPVDCETSIWYIRGSDGYYNLDQSRQRFNELWLHYDDPRIGIDEDATELQQASADIKNRVLEAITMRNFDDIRFDRLDHQQLIYGNAGLGYYERRWEGRYELTDAYGACRLAQSGCPVECRLFITRIVVLAHVVLEHLRPTMLDAETRQYEPHVRFLIFAELETEARLNGSCSLTRWDGQVIPLSLDGLIVQPPGTDWIVFRDSRNRMLKPPPSVEWRGFLGGHSRPYSSWYYRGYCDPAGVTDVCEQVVEMFQDVPIYGWPVRVDQDQDHPWGIYRGSVTIGLRPW